MADLAFEILSGYSCDICGEARPCAMSYGTSTCESCARAMVALFDKESEKADERTEVPGG